MCAVQIKRKFEEGLIICKYPKNYYYFPRALLFSILVNSKFMKVLFEQPFTLALSSGFFGFYAHVGFLKALEDLQIKPAAYSGTSAGGLVAAAAARGMRVQEIEKLITGVTRKDFWDPSLGLGLLRGEKFYQIIKKEIASDFNELQAPLRIPVFDIARGSTQVLTSGNLAKAIQATCAVPLMFQPVRIADRFYYDGGIQDKKGVHGIAQDEKILCHFLKSTLRDPHSIYELKRDEDDLKKRGENIFQVQLDHLPKAHPFAMHRGPDIIKAAYEQALRALTT
jgi:NTE family protein